MYVVGDSFGNVDKELLEVELLNMVNGHGRWACDNTKMDNLGTNVVQLF